MSLSHTHSYPWNVLPPSSIQLLACPYTASAINGADGHMTLTNIAHILQTWMRGTPDNFYKRKEGENIAVVSATYSMRYTHHFKSGHRPNHTLRTCRCGGTMCVGTTTQREGERGLLPGLMAQRHVATETHSLGREQFFKVEFEASAFEHKCVIDIISMQP